MVTIRQKAMITFFMLNDSAYLQSFYYRIATEWMVGFYGGGPE